MADVSPPSGRRSPRPRHLAAGANGGPDGDRAYPPGDRAYSGPQARARTRPPAAAPAGPATAEDEDAPSAAHSRQPEHRPRRSLGRTVLEWVAVILGGIIIALVVEAFLVQAFWIPSVSMSPTLEVGDRVLVNKLSYRLHDVHRGDVVVFSRPAGTESGPDDNIKDLIKRVVAVGGDTIEGRDGRVYVNDRLIDEPYLPIGTRTDDLPRQTLPKGKVFVMGDNRGDSQDSRIFGPIDEDTIVGRAFVKVLPLTDLGWL